MGERSRTTAIAAAIALILLSAGAIDAPAARADVGFPGLSYGGGGSPSGSKPQSKAWFAGGRWWASMVDAAGAHRIHALDRAAQTWSSTGVALDARSNSRDDVLYDEAGGKLYVASHVFTGETTGGATTTVGQAGRLYRFSFDAAGGGSHTLDPGYPVTVNLARSETLVIARDSTGTLWATWVQDRRVHVSHTLGSDREWSDPVVVSGTGDLAADDISTAIAFGGDRIGVMWSDQAAGRVRFAVHRDGEPTAAWSVETVPTGWTPDDHLNLKADAQGRVYAATKTSSVSPADPLSLLLVRDTDGTWSTRVVGTVADNHTRPIVVLDEARDRLHVLATRGQSGGPVLRKSTTLSAPSFAPGPGAAVMDPAAAPDDLNDVTSSKDNVSAASGIVAIANDNTADRYWHADIAPDVAPEDGPEPVVARFEAAPTSGEGALTVPFEDESTGDADEWAWSFGDGATSTARNPTHRYTAPGTYTVTLRVTDAGGSSDEERRTGLVVVRPAPAPPAPTVTAPPARLPAPTPPVPDPPAAEQPATTPQPAPAPKPAVLAVRAVAPSVGLRAERVRGGRVRFVASVRAAPAGARATLQLRSASGRWVKVSARLVRSGNGAPVRYAVVLRRRATASSWRVTVAGITSRPLRLAGARLTRAT